jgi:hypothetical protein
MDAILGAISVKDLGVGVLLGVAILMVFRGLLVPVRYYDRMEANKDAQIAQWRETADNYKAAFEEERRQKNLLLSRDDLAMHTLTEIRAHVRDRLDEGGEES